MHIVTTIVAITVLFCLASAAVGLKYGRTRTVTRNAAGVAIFTSASFFAVTCLLTVLFALSGVDSIVCYLVTGLLLCLSTFTGFMGIGYRVSP